MFLIQCTFARLYIYFIAMTTTVITQICVFIQFWWKYVLKIRFFFIFSDNYAPLITIMFFPQNRLFLFSISPRPYILVLLIVLVWIFINDNTVKENHMVNLFDVDMHLVLYISMTIRIVYCYLAMVNQRIWAILGVLKESEFSIRSRYKYTHSFFCKMCEFNTSANAA